MPNAGFEDGTLTGWSRGSQTGTLGASINGGGTGVTIFNGSRTFTHGANGAMGSPTINKPIPNTSPQQYEIVDNPYYAPAVVAGSWTFSPKGGTYAVALQPKGEQTFTQATAALGLSGTQTSQIATMLSSQAQASGFGSGNPTDAAWITREVQLTAGITYTMSWNYMATDYVPFNDGSITSLVPVTVASTPAITVNNFNQSYALLGFSNPGTGDYSTNSYGATGWQVSTYKVSVTGTYKLGFTSFNLDDQGLPPVLMVDDQIGTTLSCNQSGGSCAVFGGVEPNNETAPTLPPTTTTTSTTTTTTTTTTVPDTTTTTTVPYFNSIQNLTAIANDDGSVTLSWDAPDASNTQPYMYSILFYNLDNNIESGGWGVWTYAANTTYVIDTSGQTGYGSVRFKIQAGTAPCVGEGIGSCLYGPQEVADATTSDPDTTTTTTTIVPQVPTGTTTTTTTAPEVVPPPVETLPTENTTVSIPDLDLTPVSTPETQNTTVTTPELDPTPVSTPEIDTTPVAIPEPEDLPNETIPEISIPEETQNTADETITDIFNNADNPDELGAAVTDAIDNADSPEEIAALVTSLFDGPMNNEEFSAVVDSIFADDLSTEELSAVLDAVFAEPLSDEKFAEVIDAVLDSPLTDEQFAEVVDILESDTVSEEQVADAVDSILDNGVTADQATDLATSDKVLESIDGDQASEIFAEIPVGELTQTEEAALVDAVTNAPEEVKNAFEETIDVYGEGLDDYVPVGSNVDVGSRRTLLAATAALTAATAGMTGTSGPSGGSGGSGGGSGGSGGSGGGPGDGTNRNGRKEDENPNGEEEDTEIEGPEDQEDNHFTRNSIFKYEEETMKRKFSPWGFIKKFSRETSALAFTISGSVVVFATLSGETRKITIIATGCAFLVHYVHAMIKNDED
jgi:hypothetical protein